MGRRAGFPTPKAIADDRRTQAPDHGPAEASTETDSEGYLAGHVLVAMPGMQDPRFARSVVCLCAHSPEGAMGLIMNKPLPGLSFDDLLKQLGLDPVPPARRIRMVSGGPVESGRGFVLHTPDWEAEGSLRISSDIALTASVDILKAIASGGGPAEGFLALGYAGWGPGQLESEILANAWLAVPADRALLFAATPEAMWRDALARLRVDPAALSGTAGRA